MQSYDIRSCYLAAIVYGQKMDILSENIYLFLNKESSHTYIDAAYSRLCLACPSFYQVTGSFPRLKAKYGNMTRIITWLKFRAHTLTNNYTHTHTLSESQLHSHTHADICRYENIQTQDTNIARHKTSSQKHLQHIYITLLHLPNGHELTRMCQPELACGILVMNVLLNGVSQCKMVTCCWAQRRYLFLRSRLADIVH